MRQSGAAGWTRMVGVQVILSVVDVVADDDSLTNHDGRIDLG